MKSVSVKALIEAAGGRIALSERLGITPQAVSQWDQVPQAHARIVAKMTGTPLYVIRPDIWSKADSK